MAPPGSKRTEAGLPNHCATNGHKRQTPLSHHPALLTVCSDLRQIDTDVAFHEDISPMRGYKHFARYDWAVLFQPRHLLAGEPEPHLRPPCDGFDFDRCERRIPATTGTTSITRSSAPTRRRIEAIGMVWAPSPGSSNRHCTRERGPTVAQRRLFLTDWRKRRRQAQSFFFSRISMDQSAKPARHSPSTSGWPARSAASISAISRSQRAIHSAPFRRSTAISSNERPSASSFAVSPLSVCQR